MHKKTARLTIPQLLPILPVKGAIALEKNRKSFDDDEEKKGIFAGYLPLALSPLVLASLALTLASLALACP